MSIQFDTEFIVEALFCPLIKPRVGWKIFDCFEKVGLDDFWSPVMTGGIDGAAVITPGEVVDGVFVWKMGLKKFASDNSGPDEAASSSAGIWATEVTSESQHRKSRTFGKKENSLEVVLPETLISRSETDLLCDPKFEESVKLGLSSFDEDGTTITPASI